MKIGFVGLGKLGLPVALSIARHDHEVIGYDPSPKVQEIIDTKNIPYKEIRAQEYLNTAENFRFGSLNEVVAHSELIFVPIQTPHDPKFEGTTRLPSERQDFDYDFLEMGVRDIALTAKGLKKQITIIIISTVLPGTIERVIKPLLNEYVSLIYNPFFIAMGTTINDFENPELVLIGRDNLADVSKLGSFYKTIHDRPLFITDIKTAELTKVAYNTFIGQKITFINAMMEICHKVGANVDDLSSALSMANERIISPKYLRGGMGDGGGCHPRDNIAMSWLAKELNLSHNIFEDQMKTREDQTEWLTRLIEQARMSYDPTHDLLPVYILGKAYKPESNLVVGSPATLLANILKERNIPFTHFDPYIDEEDQTTWETPAVYFIATKHNDFKTWQFSKGDVVIDPFGYIPDIAGVEVIRIGRGKAWLK